MGQLTIQLIKIMEYNIKELPSTTKENDTCSSERAFATVVGNPDGSCTMIDFTEASEVERALEVVRREMSSVVYPPSEDNYRRAMAALRTKVHNLINALEAEKSLSLKNEEKMDAKKFDSRGVDTKQDAKPEITVYFQTPVDSSRGFNSETWRDVTAKDVGELKPELKIDMKEERFEPVSIWKDVSEIKWASEWIAETTGGDAIFIDTISEFYESQKFIDKICTLKDFINEHKQMQKDIEDLKRKLSCKL